MPSEGTGSAGGDARTTGRKRVWARRLSWGLLALVTLVVGTFFFLMETRTGQRFLLDQGLSRIQGVVRGSILVDDIRSDDLREGVTLYHVRVDDLAGDPFVIADSVTVSYEWRSFLKGHLHFDDASIFGPTVRVVRGPGEEDFNVQRIFSSDGAESDGPPGFVRSVVVADLTILDGDVRVRYPQEGPLPPRALGSETPDGTLLREMVFEEVNAALTRAVVIHPDLEGSELTFEGLSTRALVYEDPAELDDLEGVVHWTDDRLRIQASRIVTGETRASGTIDVDLAATEGLVATLDLTTSSARLEDLQWIEPRLPAGSARGSFVLDLRPGALDWSFDETTVDLGESVVEATGGWSVTASGMAFRNLDLDLSPLDLDRVRPWADFEIPFEGELDGRARLDGDYRALRTDGDLTFRPARQPVGASGAPPLTRAVFEGVLHLEGRPGVTDLELTLDPLDWALVSELAPASRLRGSGEVELQASGRLGSGLRFTADIRHAARGVPSSSLLVGGSVLRSEEEGYVLDVTADVSPLSFTALRRYYAEVPLSGEVRGMIGARGPLSDLRVTTDLATPAGIFDLESRFDARDIGRSYRVDGTLSDFRFSELLPGIPDPTVFTGEVSLQGSGLDPATARAALRVDAGGSRVGGLLVDTATAAVRLEGGRLEVDTLTAVLGGIDVIATGNLAVDTASPAGELRVSFATDSIGGLRPLFLGDRVMARDTLQGLYRELVIQRGIDPDTLPTTTEVRLSGSAEGEVHLRGSLGDFAAEGSASVRRIVFGENLVGGASIDFRGRGLPGRDAELHAEVSADSLLLEGRSFEAARLEVEYTHPTGRVYLELDRHAVEDYRARAVVQLDSAGGSVVLDELSLRLDTLEYRLADQAAVSWSEGGVTFDGFELVRPGPTPFRLRLDGRLPKEGEASFLLDLEGVHLERIAQIAQREELGVSGRVDARLEIRGRAASPVMTGSVDARDLRYRGFSFTRVEGEVGYEDRNIRLDLSARNGDIEVLSARGTVPADLSFTGVEDRLPEREMDLSVTIDSLPAASIVGLVEGVEEISGNLDGDFTVAGTLDSPSPQGTVVANGVGFFITGLGVRYRDVGGTFELRPDGTVRVDASARAGGTLDVTGTVTLDPSTDPGFDLLLEAQRFRAVSRRDVEGTVTGAVTLTDRFTSPDVEGLQSSGRGLRVDQGVLRLEEFLRAASVVDLADPRFMQQEDTLIQRVQSVIAASRNPFLDNLRVDVDLAVERDTWLRSEDLNVEMTGDLVVTYARRQREIVLVGELTASRGDYTVLGRRFQVEEGTIEFVGTPGINPNLDITAQTRVRRGQEAEPLVVTATVGGTLEDPAVGLGTPDASVAQEDLVSYLLFNRPSYALTSGQSASLQGVGGGLVGASLSAGGSVLAGTLTSRIGSLVAQEIGLDYFAISQQSGLAGGGLGSTFTQTTVEAGRYLEENLFAVLVLRPLSGLGGASNSVFGGLRLEWTPSDLYTVEFFLEDRFLRSGIFGFQELAVRSSIVGGVSVFWEWGY